VADNLSQLFHRAFNEPPKRLGLSTVDPHATSEERCTRRDLWDSINAYFRNQAARFRVEGQPPQLYFDFIRADTFNASSKFYADIYFVGLHDVAVGRIIKLATALAQRSTLYKALGIMDVADTADSPLLGKWTPSSDLIVAQQSSLAQYIAMFVVGHELGHHVHGHTTMNSTNEKALERHAAETEADAYSVCFTMRSFLNGPYMPIRDRSVARSIFLAAAVYLDCVADPMVDWARLREQDYPPYSIRLEYIHGAIQATWRNLRPNTEDPLDWNTVDDLLKSALGVWGRDEDSLTLIRQTEGLNEDTLATYNKDLVTARTSLREQLRSMQWQVIVKEIESGEGVDNGFKDAPECPGTLNSGSPN
jgi:hypothetical protein